MFSDKKFTKGGIDLSVVLIIFLIAVALFAGFLFGLTQGKKSVAPKTSGPGSAVEIDTGYQNPFEGVKFNPFK